MTRESFFLVVVVTIVLAVGGVVHADDKSRDDAIASGIGYLAKQQNLDGSFESDGHRFSTTGLTLLAFLSDGNTSDGGDNAPIVRRAIEFLLLQSPADHNFGAADQSHITGQAIVTLALCEAYGVEPDEPTRVRLREAAKAALNVLIAAQNIKKAADHEGGWNDDPSATDSNPIVSRWCLAAYRAADAIGLVVPKANLDRAASFVASHNLASQTRSSTQASAPGLGDSYFVVADGPDAHTSDSIIRALIESQSPDGNWGSLGETSLNLLTLSVNRRFMPIQDH